jgi:hypothetical protein
MALSTLRLLTKACLFWMRYSVLLRVRRGRSAATGTLRSQLPTTTATLRLPCPLGKLATNPAQHRRSA